MKSVLIAELAWPDYGERVRAGAPVFIPVGALEQHGPHMSMNPDVLLPTAVSSEVARQVDGLVAPAIAYGYKSQQRSGGGNHMMGTTSLDGQTMTCVVKDVIREFVRHGVRKIIFVNGHYENAAFLTEGVDLALRESGWSGIHDLRCLILSYWDYIDEETIRQIYKDEFPGWAVEHGGVLETSLMLHLHPELVDMDKVADHPPASFPPYDLFPVDPSLTPTSGCLSSARKARAEFGELILRVCVEGIAASVREVFS